MVDIPESTVPEHHHVNQRRKDECQRRAERVLLVNIYEVGEAPIGTSLNIS